MLYNRNNIWVVIMAMTFVSCKKEFLEIPSETNLSSAVFFKTQSDFEQAINGAYAPLRTLYNNPAGNNTSAYIMGEMHSDNTHYVINPGFRATIDQEQIADFISDPSSATATNKYTTNYLIIARANQVLDLIDDMTFDQSAKDNIKGQALFLRSLAYLELAQFYGSVPLHLKPAKSREETALPLTSMDSIYLQVTSDAQQAATLLPPKSGQQAGRATSGAAKAVLANVYLIQKKYSEAETVLKEIVNSGEYSLLADYAAVFSPSNKNNSESVFEVQYKEGTDGFASNFINPFLPMPISAADVAAVFSANGVTPISVQALSTEGYNIPTPDLLAAYEAGDKRKDASVGFVTTNGTTYPFIKKYLHPHGQFGLTNDNWPVYRYAEILLSLAEALNEQNKTTEALTYLNMVHAGARTGLTAVAATDQATLRGTILHERRVELAFENKRWLDLLRTGNAVPVITAYGASVKANPTAYYYPAGQAPPPAAFTTIDLKFPLPASEALLSPYF